MKTTATTTLPPPPPPPHPHPSYSHCFRSCSRCSAGLILEMEVHVLLTHFWKAVRQARYINTCYCLVITAAEV